MSKDHHLRSVGAEEVVSRSPIEEPYGYVLARREGLGARVEAMCGCGWRGTQWAGVAPLGEATLELDQHVAATGHRRVVEGDGSERPAGEWFHAACGTVHGWDMWCPASSTSPRGRVSRAVQGTRLRDAGAAFDRLAAIHELEQWLEHQRDEALIAARVCKVSWAEIGAASGGLSRQAAWNRWGAMIQRLEEDGLLDSAP